MTLLAVMEAQRERARRRKDGAKYNSRVVDVAKLEADESLKSTFDKYFGAEHAKASLEQAAYLLASTKVGRRLGAEECACAVGPFCAGLRVSLPIPRCCNMCD